MALQPVEWVLVVFYCSEAHRATYGRQVQSNRYTKDYIQLSRKEEFLEMAANLFSVDAEEDSNSVPITFKWPSGSAAGSFIFNSADRPHLKWETRVGAPQAWKMALTPSDDGAETIPGDPSHLDFESAESERTLVERRGGGQPYLIIVKLKNESRVLHIRVYLKNPDDQFAWADIEAVPSEIRALADKTSRQSALSWSGFQSGGVATSSTVEEAIAQIQAAEDLESGIDMLDERAAQALVEYLQHPGYGLFFDPAVNHAAWSIPTTLPKSIAESAGDLEQMLTDRFPPNIIGHDAAENFDYSSEEVQAFLEQIEQESYEVADIHATVKTRGSAQKAFANAVKNNYGYQCAITGVRTPNFLIASHIVPWSADLSIRLDPANGICLSLLVDRAFETGHIVIDEDLMVRVNWEKVGEDQALRDLLALYDGRKLNVPAKGAPNPMFLLRRRVLVEQG